MYRSVTTTSVGDFRNALTPCRPFTASNTAYPARINVARSNSRRFSNLTFQKIQRHHNPAFRTAMIHQTGHWLNYLEASNKVTSRNTGDLIRLMKCWQANCMCQ